MRLCLRFGKNCYLAKTDLKSAFRQLPIRKEDLNLLGMKHQGLWYLDRCLPFGVSLACKIFEEFSSALHWKVGLMIAEALVHYLDDFLFAGDSIAKVNESLEVFRKVCKGIGFPIAEGRQDGWTNPNPPLFGPNFRHYPTNCRHTSKQSIKSFESHRSNDRPKNCKGKTITVSYWTPKFLLQGHKRREGLHKASI